MNVPVTTESNSVEPARGSSYGQILKSSALISGSTAISVVLGMVRTKVLAVIVGPSGTGLLGMYGSITNIAQLLSGMGLNTSGVRQIAEAMGSNDQTRIALVSTTLRRLVLLSRPIANMTFNDASRWREVALLGFVVYFSSISAAQIALLQGLRRIRDMAKATVLGALFGTLVSIPLVYLFGMRGILYYLIAVAAAAVFVSWRIARTVALPGVCVDAAVFLREGRCLVKIGFFFMLSAATIGASDYFVKVSIARHIGLVGVGNYQAAWTLSFLSIGVVTQALGSDFYPRLSAASGDDSRCNQLLNEQIQMSLLLAMPSILAALVFAPQIIRLFYSQRFTEAALVLRFQVVGVLLAVVFAPLSYLLLAKGKTLLYLLSTITTSLSFVLVAIFGLPIWGLRAAGVAFSLHVALALVIAYIMAHSLTGFAWHRTTGRHGLACGVFLLLGLGLVTLGGRGTSIAGLLLVLFVSLYCLRELVGLLGWQKLPLPIRSLGLLLTRLR